MMPRKRDRMGWLTTTDLEHFRAAAGAYLNGRGGEGTLLRTASRAISGERPLCGWWVTPGGGDVRGAFLHDPPALLLIAGRVPEFAAALAPVLDRQGCEVGGVDATAESADAFAAAWTARTGASARLHRHVRIYRMAGPLPALEGPAGSARVACERDTQLLAGWLSDYGAETGDVARDPEEAARGLIGYGGAIFWEADGRAVALATLTRPVERAVRVALVYTPHPARHRGFAAAVTVAASRAALAREDVQEVLLIADRSSPVLRARSLGYELASERVQLKFGPPAGPMVRLTGPLARLRGRVGHA